MPNFVITTFVVLTVANNAGQLAPVDKSELPAGFTSPIMWSVETCNLLRGKMEHPEKYVCQVFKSAPTTEPEERRGDNAPQSGNAAKLSQPNPASLGERSGAAAVVGHLVGPTELRAKDAPTIEPNPASVKPEDLPRDLRKQKQERARAISTAQAARQEPQRKQRQPSQQAMFEGGPNRLGLVVRLATGDW